MKAFGAANGQLTSPPVAGKTEEYVMPSQRSQITAGSAVSGRDGSISKSESTNAVPKMPLLNITIPIDDRESEVLFASVAASAFLVEITLQVNLF